MRGNFSHGRNMLVSGFEFWFFLLGSQQEVLLPFQKSRGVLEILVDSCRRQFYLLVTNRSNKPPLKLTFKFKNF